MSVQSKNTLKYWFIKYAKPTASQFADLFDSFWHKSEVIPINKIDGLESILNTLNVPVGNKLIPNTLEVDASNAPTGYFNAGVTNTLHKVSYYDSGQQINFNVSAVTAENGDWMGVEDTQGFGVILVGFFQGNVNNVSIIGGNGTGGATAYFHYNDGDWRFVCVTKSDKKPLLIKGSYTDRMLIDLNAYDNEGVIFEEITSSVLTEIYIIKNHAWTRFIDTQSAYIASDTRPINSVALAAYVASKNDKTVIVDKNNGNDATAVKYSKTLVYSTITAATAVLTYGDYLYVRGSYLLQYSENELPATLNETVYIENNITMVNGTTVYLEDGVVVKSADSYITRQGRTLLIPYRGNIFTYVLNSTEKAFTWSLLGRGRVLSNGDTQDDTCAINIQAQSAQSSMKIHIEAKELTSLSVWANYIAQINIVCKNLKFKNGLIAIYGNNLASIVQYENCVMENTRGFTREFYGLSGKGGGHRFINCKFLRTIYPYPIETIYTDPSDSKYLFDNPGYGYTGINYANRDTIGVNGFEGFQPNAYLFEQCTFFNSINGNGLTAYCANPAGSEGRTIKLIGCNFFQNDVTKYAVVMSGISGGTNGTTGTGASTYLYFAANISNTSPLQVIAPAVFINQYGGGNGFTQLNAPSGDIKKGTNAERIAYAATEGIIWEEFNGGGILQATYQYKNGAWEYMGRDFVNGSNWVQTNNDFLVADSYNILTETAVDTYVPAVEINKSIIIQASKVPFGVASSAAPSDAAVNLTIHGVYLNGGDQSGSTTLNITNTNQVVHLLGTYYGWHVISHSNKPTTTPLTQSITYGNTTEATSSGAVFDAIKNRGLIGGYDAYPTNGGYFVGNRYNTVVVTSSAPIIIRMPTGNQELYEMIVEVRRGNSPYYGGEINVQIKDAYTESIYATVTEVGKILFTANHNTGNLEAIASTYVNTATQTALDALIKRGTNAQRLAYSFAVEGMKWIEVDSSALLVATYKYRLGTWILDTQATIACGETVPRCDIISVQTPVAGTVYYANHKVRLDISITKLTVYVSALNATDTWYLDVFKASDRSRVCGGTLTPSSSNSFMSCTFSAAQLNANTDYLFALRSVNGTGSFGYRAGLSTSATTLTGVVLGVTGATPSTLPTGASGSVYAFMEYSTN